MGLGTWSEWPQFHIFSVLLPFISAVVCDSMHDPTFVKHCDKTIYAHSSQKLSDTFNEILQAKAYLGKYLMEKC